MSNNLPPKALEAVTRRLKSEIDLVEKELFGRERIDQSRAKSLKVRHARLTKELHKLIEKQK